MAQQSKKKSNPVVTLIALIVVGILIYSFVFSDGNSSGTSKTTANLSNSEYTSDMKITMVTYAQLAIKEYLLNTKFPAGMDSYTIVRTGDRYKIEGTVSNEKFWVVINWDYKNPDTWEIVSVQVGEVKFKESK